LVEEKEKEKAPAKAVAAIKAKRPTPPPVKSAGSGLLSGSDLFGGPSAGTDVDRARHGVDIDIRIQLNPAGGNTINIAKEIMKKYGADAINPRAAAHRERLMEVELAQKRLENGSADDMSLDPSDTENDSNVEMGGMDDSSKGAEDGAEDDKSKPRKRRKKIEEYDKEDDFIDDTELAWVEGAAVAKDGFFVYSGPLVPEGEKAQIERYALLKSIS